MPRRRSRTLTDLELAIMLIVWERTAATVEEVRQALAARGHALALPSVRTMLTILETKKYVARAAEGRRHVFRARVTREDAQRSIVKDVVERAFQGSALDLVAALVDSRMVGKNDAAKVAALIRRAEQEERKR